MDHRAMRLPESVTTDYKRISPHQHNNSSGMRSELTAACPVATIRTSRTTVNIYPLMDDHPKPVQHGISS